MPLSKELITIITKINNHETTYSLSQRLEYALMFLQQLADNNIYNFNDDLAKYEIDLNEKPAGITSYYVWQTLLNFFGITHMEIMNFYQNDFNHNFEEIDNRYFRRLDRPTPDILFKKIHHKTNSNTQADILNRLVTQLIEPLIIQEFFARKSTKTITLTGAITIVNNIIKLNNIDTNAKKQSTPFFNKTETPKKTKKSFHSFRIFSPNNNDLIRQINIVLALAWENASFLKKKPPTSIRIMKDIMIAPMDNDDTKLEKLTTFCQKQHKMGSIRRKLKRRHDLTQTLMGILIKPNSLDKLDDLTKFETKFMTTFNLPKNQSFPSLKPKK